MAEIRQKLTLGSVRVYNKYVYMSVLYKQI